MSLLFKSPGCPTIVDGAQWILWFASVFLYKTFEETFGRPAISSGVQKHVNNLTVLIYITPQIVLIS